MKKLLSLALAAALLTSAAPALAAGGEMAVATTQSVEVDGKSVEFETYALLDERGYPTNYAKLRDVAHVLNGTDAQFSVEWSAREGISVTTGKAYTPDGTEMSTPYEGDRACQRLGETTEVDGTARHIAAIRLFDDNGDGYTYYKLRDLGQYLGFQVDWSQERGVYVETGKLYGGLDKSAARALEGTWPGKLDLSGLMARTVEAEYGQALEGYFHFEAAQAAVTLTSDSLGRYTVTLDARDLDAALAQVRTDFVDGMMTYMEAMAKKLGVTMDQVMQANGQTQAEFRAQLGKEFDDGMVEARKAVLLTLNANGVWAVENGAYRLTGGDGERLPCTLTAAETLELKVDEDMMIVFTREG